MVSVIREKLRGFGRAPFVFLLTICATLMACSLDFILIYSFEIYHPFIDDIWVIVSLAVIITCIVTPILSWYLIGLFLKVDQLEMDMAQMAKVDELTKTYNRGYFYKESARILSQEDDFSVPDISSFALLVMDLDKFKQINDEFGHDCGDKVLAEFGRILLNCAKPPNMVGRLGGEEFAVLMPNARYVEAEKLAEKIGSTTRTHSVEYNNQKVFFSVSIGISLDVKSSATTIDGAFKEADIAMYQAKEKGRDRYQVFGLSNDTNVHQLY